MVYADGNNNGVIEPTEILEEHHYYPFGFEHQNYSTITGNTRYKYTFGGKEFQPEKDMNIYNFGARNYDPALGRWMNIDPLAEQYWNMNPYGYALGNNAMGKDISGFLVEAHKSNTSTTSNSARYNENEKIDWQYLKSSKPYLGKIRYAKYHYHSHPDNSLASDDDKLNFKGKSIPHFIISKKYNQQYNDVNVFEAKSR